MVINETARRARPLAFILLLACNERVQITSKHDVAVVVNQCVVTTGPTFLVRPKQEHDEFRSITAKSLVRPQTLLAPYSIEEYKRGVAATNPYAEILRVFPTGLTVQTRSVWRLQTFEGTRLAVSASISQGSYRTSDAEVSSLLNDKWQVFLGDGELSTEEKIALVGTSVFDHTIVKPCR